MSKHKGLAPAISELYSEFSLECEEAELMGILDEAIREHLELKRKQGAEQGELRQLEDEAFGPPPRPEGDEGADRAEISAEATDEPETTIVPAAAGPTDDAPSQVEAPADAVERETAAETQLDREAIAQQPTQVFDVAGELAREDADEPSSDSGELDSDAENQDPGAAASATETGTAEHAPPSSGEAVEPPMRIETPPPAPEPEDAGETAPAEVEEEEEPSPDSAAPTDEPAQAEIFDEQSLSEELDLALDDPAGAEPRKPAFFDETDEFQTPQRPRRQPVDSPDTSEEDVLEETPEFLEETPEHDRLWFEQKPPKDFDFND